MQHKYFKKRRIDAYFESVEKEKVTDKWSFDFYLLSANVSAYNFLWVIFFALFSTESNSASNFAL
jgi:hypothetical protein